MCSSNSYGYGDNGESLSLQSKQLDGFRWRCRIHRNDKISVRDDSWVADSRLTFQQFAITVCFWSVGIQNHQIISMLNLSEPNVVQYFQYFPDVCSHWVLEKPIQLGGVGYTVQIDESLLSKRKNNRGRISPQRWIFGIYDVEQKLGYLREGPDRSAATLLPIIQEIVLPGTVIHSDEWAAYNGIANLPVVTLIFIKL